MRYYIGVDWADEEHAGWVEDEQGQRVRAGMVPHSAVGFSEWGRQVDEWRAQGIALWAAIERPEKSANRRHVHGRRGGTEGGATRLAWL